MLQRPQPSPITAIILGAAALGCTLTATLAQRGDGFTLQKTPGLALVKPQPWSKVRDATVTEFSAFIDRRSTGGAASGYYEFHSDSGRTRQIPSARVVKVVVYPDPAQIKTLVSKIDREEVQAVIDDINNVIANFPATKRQLEPAVDVLAGELKKFDTGQVKADGVWISRKDYIRAQAKELVSLLKAEIANANPPHSFELEMDPKYVALREFAETDPALKPLADNLANTHSERVRVTKREALLAQLANPALTLPAATKIVAQLKTLKPEEDPASAAFVKAWDASVSTVEATSATADALAGNIESELAAAPVGGSPPQLSPELDGKISDLNRTIVVFKATSPPPQLLAATAKTQAVCAFGSGFKTLSSLFQANQFLQAQDILGELSPQAPLIGPKTGEIMVGLQQATSSKIDEFSKLRTEAKLLSDSGKSAEALARYEQAYAVIPDSTVAVEIENLKAAVPASE